MTTEKKEPYTERSREAPKKREVAEAKKAPPGEEVSETKDQKKAVPAKEAPAAREGADVDQRKTDHAAQLELGHGHLRARALLLQRIEGHREQIAPGLQRAFDDRSGNSQIVRLGSSGRLLAGTE